MFIELTSQQIQRSLVGFALLVGFGVLVHDTKIDQATALALALPAGIALASVAMPHNEGHTHAERGAYGKTTVLGMPRVQPRDDHRKYVLNKRPSGFNAPEGHTLLVEPTLA